MAFKMNGSAFKLGGVQGTSGHASALKQKQEQDSALQCRMYNKANQFRMKSPLEQSCPAPPADAQGYIDEETGEKIPFQMKSAFKQYDRDEKEGFVYDDEVVTMNEDGTTTYTKKGTKKGTKGGGGSSGMSYEESWDNLSPARKAKYGSYEDYEAEAKEYNMGTPDQFDEMSYTTKPDVEALSLAPITPELSVDADMQPETAKMKRKKKSRGRKVPSRRKKKQNIFTSGHKRKKAMRKVGDFLNPFNDGKKRRCTDYW